jgi:hypothetical protein
MDPELLHPALCMTTIYFCHFAKDKKNKNYLLLPCHFAKDKKIKTIYFCLATFPEHCPSRCFICTYVYILTLVLTEFLTVKYITTLNVTINVSIHCYPSSPLFQVSTRLWTTRACARANY